MIRNLDDDKWEARVQIWPLPDSLFRQMEEWLYENAEDEWTYTFGTMCFSSKKDAVTFKLKFGGS